MQFLNNLFKIIPIQKITAILDADVISFLQQVKVKKIQKIDENS